MTAQPTDLELVAAARAGDPRALEALLVRHAPMVRRVGARLSRTEADADDVLQDTLLTAARSFEGFRGEASFSTWLYTIARSHAQKRRGRGKLAAAPTVSLEDSVEALELLDEGDHPEDAMLRHELGEAVARALTGLDPVSREIVILRDVEGLSAKEVAGALGVGVDAVKSRLHRARVRLRDALGAAIAPAEAGCPDVVTLFSRYLEGEIDAVSCERMQAHVEGCGRCSSACDSLRTTLRACSASVSGRVADEVQAQVRAALERVHDEAHRRERS